MNVIHCLGLITFLHAVFRVIQFERLRSGTQYIYTAELWPPFVMMQLSFGLMLFGRALFFLVCIFLAEIELRKRKDTTNNEWSKDDSEE